MYENRNGLQVATELCHFIEHEVMPGTDVVPSAFWRGYAELVEALGPEIAHLLSERDRLQGLLDQWHKAHRANEHDALAYKQFLRDIGYLVVDNAPLAITTAPVDPEIGILAGPQLVAPVMNARFALNAANARWGSLYDAFYGTDVVPQDARMGPGNGYDAVRGAAVMARAAAFLDEALPLEGASHGDVTAYELANGAVGIMTGKRQVALYRPEAFLGHAERGSAIVLLFEHHGLHLELIIDRSTPAGAQHAAGLADIILESALPPIQDCEDSVAAVDAADKVLVYRNWLGLMRGDLVERFDKGGREVVRRLAPDRDYIDRHGAELTLPGRSLMLVRNVGHLMTTDAVRDARGAETPEGFLDAMVTVLAALHDLRKTGGPRNSRCGSVYVVKPKMHGPAEVKLVERIFARVEDALGLARNTVKIGVMDEERRTSLNLRACMRAVKDRLAFINTGFLDRTGDEIHTSMEAGPVLTKAAMRTARWFDAYENNNVDAGLAAGLPGHGQVGKGMWAKPDALAEMVKTKAGHPKAGASTAWVPSPTAATLHAMHYHQVNVADVQDTLRTRVSASIDDILEIPLLGGVNLSAETVRREVDNNAQGILGYVVRWIDQGIGCSKVPDIDNVALMEDRATLRISSQHIANWLRHGLVSEQQVRDAMQRMAEIVDRQNAGDPTYRPMAPAFEKSIAFQTACALIFEGLTQPNGYTEPLLHQGRRRKKAELVGAEEGTK